MAGSIRERLREAILKEEKRPFETREEAYAKDRAVQDLFRPICQAAEEISDELESVPSLKFTINPTSVWITLFDREIRFSCDADSQKFVSEESGHTWYDRETYTDLQRWDTVEECIDAMIRSSAAYARMARTIQSAMSAA